MMFCVAFFLAVFLRYWLDLPSRNEEEDDVYWEDLTLSVPGGVETISFQRDGGAVMVSNNGNH